MRELTEMPMIELTDAELKEVAGGAVDQIHTDGIGGPLGDQHHGTGGNASNMNSFENGAINNITHIFK